MQEYVSEQQRLNREVLAVINQLPILSVKAAETERDYRKALSIKTLTLKKAGYPVTIMNELTRGDDKVADLRFKRDVARENLKIAYEKIYFYKWQVRILTENTKIDMAVRD